MELPSGLESLPSKQVDTWLREQLGEFRYVSQFSHLHAYSHLWRVESHGKFYWLKLPVQLRKFCGEVFALTQWVNGLDLVPCVNGYSADHQAILLTECPGVDAESIELSETDESQMWRDAGAWLAQMHRYENDWFGEVDLNGNCAGRSFTDPCEWVYSSIDRRVKEADPLGLFDASELDFIHGWCNEYLSSLVGERAISIHRDFTPRNWLVQDGRLSGVIDFEHARWDLRAGDLNRTPDKEFLQKPYLRAAFFDGYGKPSDRLQNQIQIMRLFQAVGAIVWGVLVGETDYSAENRVALHRMMGR